MGAPGLRSLQRSLAILFQPYFAEYPITYERTICQVTRPLFFANRVIDFALLAIDAIIMPVENIDGFILEYGFAPALLLAA